MLRSELKLQILSAALEDLWDMGYTLKDVEKMHESVQMCRDLYKIWMVLPTTSDEYAMAMYELIDEFIVSNPNIVTYYKVSFKHTIRGDDWMSFWRHNNNGYCWFKEWAGIYFEDELEETTLDYAMIETSKFAGMWDSVQYEGMARRVVKMHKNNFIQLGMRETNFYRWRKTRVRYGAIKNNNRT